MSLYQVRRERQLKIRRLVVVVDGEVSVVGHVDVTELEVPEPGDGDQQVPRQHCAHPQVAEDDTG